MQRLFILIGLQPSMLISLGISPLNIELIKEGCMLPVTLPINSGETSQSDFLADRAPSQYPEAGAIGR